MSKNKKIIIGLIIVQVLMTWLAISRDSNIFSLDVLVLMPIFFGYGFWVYLLSIPTLLGLKNRFAQITNLGFYCVSIFNISYLFRLIMSVLKNGSLRESGLIFTAFPIYGFYITFGSLVIFSIAFYIKDRIQRKKWLLFVKKPNQQIPLTKSIIFYMIQNNNMFNYRATTKMMIVAAKDVRGFSVIK